MKKIKIEFNLRHTFRSGKQGEYFTTEARWVFHFKATKQSVRGQGIASSDAADSQ
jgi:hypothetical protein